MTLRKKFVGLSLRTVLFISWALGLFPFTFNAKKRKLQRSKWLIFYGISVNIGLLWFLVIYSPTQTEAGTLEVYLKNHLLEQINIIVAAFGLVAICITYFRTFWKSQELNDVLNEMMQMDKVHFNKRSLEESISKFDYYVMQKSLSTIGEVLSTVIVHVGLPGHKNVIFPLLMSCIVHVGILLVIMHFYLVILFIYRFIWIINRELLDLANKLRSNSHVAFPRLRLLLSLFSRLLELNSRVGGIYDYQMILMMCTVLGYNIVATYFLIVHTVSPKKTFTTFKLFLFSQALFINTWDFWLSIAVCDLAERTAQNTATILRLFSDIENMDIELDRRLNNFSMFCSHRKLRFYHCGLFDVNYKMGFQMIITSVLYLLFLVQFDYMNLV